jgi:2-polyprenyl-3-methyl-5-hydroxy-6-metoxy-1,4-benzoquinol methylase
MKQDVEPADQAARPEGAKAMTSYLLDNASPQAAQRFAGLEACYDHSTFALLSALGLTDGWRCWEIGAGGGSVARWMAEQVGPSGSVLGTDINLDWIDADMPHQVELRRHDVTSDAIPTSAYDLIHARLVLLHLPGRDQVIERLAAALAPGGWLVLEEFNQILPPCPEATTDEQRAFNRVREGFSELLARRGANTTTYPPTLPWRMQRAGLVETGAVGRLVFASGASPSAAHQRANLLQTGGEAVDAGLITADDLRTSLRALDDPGFTFILPLLISAWGRRQRPA